MARRYFKRVLAVIASATALLAVHAASAQGILMPDNARRPDGIRRPGPFPGPAFVQPFYVKNLKVTTTINDAVAETTVEQTLVNASSFQQEATYLYPLPTGANPTGFSMTIGDKTMEPRILARVEANSIYEGYVRRYRDPALLEFVGRSLVKMIVFLTDGLPTVGELNIDTILKHFKQWNQPVVVQQRPRPGVRVAGFANAPSAPARIFCFGLGYDVNVPFLDRLADLGRGDSDYIKPEEDVEARVSSFFAKVESPVLSNIAVTYNDIETYDVFPKTLPDMFKGSQVVISGRFRGNGSGTITLTGMANGIDERFKLAVKSAEADGMNTFVPRIWAQRKLGYLIDQVRLSANPAGQTELLDEIIRLSKEYGIITEYTSFLVDEQEQRRLGILSGSAGSSAVPGHTAIQRRQVAERAVQYGMSGLNVTDQSERAKDLRGSDKAASRYQSSNGSVDLYSTNALTGPGGAAQGQASAGNFKYGGGGGGLGGRPAQVPAAGTTSRGIVLGANDSGNAITMQNVAGRTFYRQANKVWADDSYVAGKQNLIKVQAFSDAHFDLLHRLPDLAVYSSVGDHVIIRVNNCAIEIGDEGKTKLTDADLKVIMAR